MKRREKLLAILAIAAVLLSQAMPVYNYFFVDPVDKRRLELGKLEAEVQDRELTARSIRRVRTNLAKWKTASLPSETWNAQRLYQEWLTDVAKMTEFADLKVTSTLNARSGKIFTPVRVSVEAKVGYDQLCRFLSRFQTADLLHRISEMNIKRAENGGGSKLAVTIVAEAIALTSAEKRDYLLPHTALKGELSRDETTVKVENTELFPEKNEFLARSGNEIFRVKSVDGASWVVERAVESTSADRHAQGATIELLHVVSKAKANAVPAIALNDVAKHNLFVKPDGGVQQDPFESDFARNTYLNAVHQGDKWEAWLYNQSNERTVLHEGSKFQIADLEATVVEFHPKYIVIEADKEKRELRLGKNLQSLSKKGGGDRGGFSGGPRGSGGGREGGPGSFGGRRGGGGGRGGRGGRGFPGMDDPAKRAEMMEKFKKFREARERGEEPDPRTFFGGEGGQPAESSEKQEESPAVSPSAGEATDDAGTDAAQPADK